MGILWALAKSSGKIMATFAVLIGMSLLLIFVFPASYITLQDWADDLDQWTRDPMWIEGTAKVMYRFLVNGTTILSVIMTVLARAIVEIAVWGGSSIMGGMNKEAERDAAEAEAGIKDQGYYES